jgi:prophage tail gpP-like protein
MVDDVVLLLDGVRYAGWTELTVRRAIDTVHGEFDLRLASRERSDAAQWPLRAGAECTLLAGSDEAGFQTLITGYIDRLSASLTDQEHAISISGRDRTGDLADCSAVHKPGSWRNVPLKKIVEDLVAPFGIAAQVTGDVGAPIPKFALQTGETVWSAIERLLKFRGLIGWTQSDGSLLIGQPGKGGVIARLAEGENLLDVSADHDVTERFSQYVVKGQASGSDERSGEAVTLVGAKATDAAVGRYRPLIIVAEEQSDKASAQKRADWEANTRAARSQPGTARVLGWRDPRGQLWRPDTRVEVDAPSAYLSGEMLVSGITFMRGNDGGTTTMLELTRPEAWTLMPVPAGADPSQVGA